MWKGIAKQQYWLELKLVLWFIVAGVLMVSVKDRDTAVYSFAALVGIGVYVCLLAVLRHQHISIPRSLIILNIIILYGFLTAIWSLNPARTLTTCLKLAVALSVLWGCGWYIGRFLDYRATYRTIAFLFAVFLLVNVTLNPSINQDLVGRFHGVTQNSVQLAMLAVLVLSPLIYASPTQTSNNIGVLLLLLVVFVLTKSRVGVASLMGGYLLLYLRDRRMLASVRTLIIMVWLVLVAMAIVYARGLDLGSRDDLWKIGMKYITMFGNGIGSSEEILAAEGYPWFNSWHNAYLGLVIEGGVPWLLGFLYFVWSAGLRVAARFRCYGETKMARVVYGVIAAFFIMQAVEFQALRNSAVFYLFMFHLAIANGALVRIQRWGIECGFLSESQRTNANGDSSACWSDCAGKVPE